MDDPIPADRVKLEARLISLIDMPRHVRFESLGDFICEPGVTDHADLLCITLAEMVRCGNQDQRRRALRLGDESEFCAERRGSHCATCPVERARLRLRRAS
jgi:hypothetical protein